MLVVLIAIAGCSAAPRQRPVKLGPVDTGPGSLAAARQYLEGRWTLESFQVFPPGRPVVALKGHGSLTYDAFGNLQMEIRADEASADLLRAAGIDIRNNTISTAGRTAVDMQNRTLTYIVPGQSPSSGPLALNRPRHWQVEADLLTLTTKDENGQALSVGRWRRMP
jgi:hypothetical protein